MEKLECRIHEIQEKNNEMVDINVSPISSEPLPFPTLYSNWKALSSKNTTQDQKTATETC